MNIQNLKIALLSHFAKSTKQLKANVDTLFHTLNKDFIIFISVYRLYLSLSFFCQTHNFPFTLIIPIIYFLVLYFTYTDRTL